MSKGQAKLHKRATIVATLGKSRATGVQEEKSRPFFWCVAVAVELQAGWQATSYFWGKLHWHIWEIEAMTLPNPEIRIDWGHPDRAEQSLDELLKQVLKYYYYVLCTLYSGAAKRLMLERCNASKLTHPMDKIKGKLPQTIPCIDGYYHFP